MHACTSSRTQEPPRARTHGLDGALADLQRPPRVPRDLRDLHSERGRGGGADGPGHSPAPKSTRRRTLAATMPMASFANTLPVVEDPPRALATRERRSPTMASICGRE